MRTVTIALCAMAIAAACLPSAAHDHATGVVKERMDMMEVMARRLKAIRDRIDGKRDPAESKADAEAIASHAAHLVRQFPPGSTQKPTDAKGTIWQNWNDFERRAAEFKTESKKLVNTTLGNSAAFNTQVRVVTDTCRACHEKYRTRRRKRIDD